MSLILDALRKMEQERRSKRGNGQDLRPEVLRYRLAAQPRQKSRYPLAIAAGVVLLCAGLGAGFMLKGRSAEQAVGEPPSATSMAQPQMEPQVPSPVPPAAVAPAPAPVAAPQPLTAPSVAAVPTAPIQNPAALPAEPARNTSRVALPPSAPEAAPQPRAPREEKATAAAGAPDIVISGIAFQDERRMRRAVLNGSLVGEGAEVAGARVVEIKETKVRLSRGGHIFEIPFSSGLQSR